jgi:hypothetical protein
MLLQEALVLGEGWHVFHRHLEADWYHGGRGLR